MTRTQVELAVKEGIPFAIKKADGNQYTVTDRSRIALGPTCVLIVDEKDLPHVLPMLTMTGISYLAAEGT